MKRRDILTKLIACLLWMVFPIMANAQVTLLPMLVEGKRWYYSYTQTEEVNGKAVNNKYWVYYTLKGDTVIDSREYMKMYRYDGVTRELNYYGAFREDEKGRVWQYDPNTETDYMTCDVTCESYENLKDESAIEDVISCNGRLLHRYRKGGLIGVEGVGLEKYGVVRVPGDEAYNYIRYETFEDVWGDGFSFSAGQFTAPTYIELTADEQKMVEQNNDFAFNLFRKARTGESKVLSPLSITYALGMLNNGAAGKTQQEIYDVLGFDDADAQNAFCRKLTDGLQMAGTVDITTKSMLSNTIFLNAGRGFELEQDFASTINQCYDASPQARDFADGQTCEVINQWASDHTEGMITKVLSESEFNPYAVSYLLNATYFKGMWSSQFEVANTIDEPFAGGGKVPMMHQTLEAVYKENDLCQMVRLPYGNGTYSMQVFLPREGKTLDEVIESLNGKNWKMSGHPYEVALALPRFQTDTDQNLVEVMSELGMPTAFNPYEADLSRMLVGDDDEDDYIGMMKQVAKIKLDEKGTEAAAVTVIEVTDGMPETAVFYANRPFFYVISEQSTGVILFMGQYMGEDTTGISPLPASPKGEEMIYNLQGQRISTMQKGLNIVDGKKVWVK